MQTTFWRFLDTTVDQGARLAVNYSPLLVFLSFAVATLAGYTALKVQERMGAAPTDLGRRVWLVLGAVAMGSGIWAMHFIGMLAFSIPVNVNYSLSVTAASLLPGVFASGIALQVLNRPRITPTVAVVGGLLMAVGIGGMHFLGMEAMRMDARMSYVMWLFVLSIVVADLLATFALIVQFTLARGRSAGSRLHTAASAALLGAAVGCMHYTAMSSARFYPAELVGTPSLVIPKSWLALAVVVASGGILGIAIIGTWVDRRLALASTSLRLAEQRARHIIDRSPLAIISMDEGGAIVDWNDQAEATFGWSHKEAVGRRVVDLIVPARHQAGHNDGMNRFLADGSRHAAGFQMEIEALRRSGEEFPVEISGSTLEREGRYLFTAFLQDISERVAARLELEEATRQAQAGALAKGEFLANMSHEIRTPMNGVIGMTQLLLDSELSAEQRERAEIVRSSAESLLTIINDILDFSKIEAGKIEVEEIDFDVRTTVEEVTSMLAHRAEESGLELMCTLKATVPRLVRGDPGRLRQVLVNLVTNAIKFTPSGEVVIYVDAERETADGVVLAFRVTDTGIGIPEERIESIFDSFTQADSTTTRHFGGTGLGLAIVRRLVDLMGGELKVDSVVGEGSAFSFTVPLATSDVPPVPTRARLKGGRVLVVDDNATNRRIVREQLDAFGLDHAEAEGGEAALGMLRSAVGEGTPYEIALLDYQMPGMDGAALGAAIKADESLKSTDLVMLTSVGRRGDAERYSKLGFAAYLVKPIKQSYLFDCLVTIMGRSGAPAPEAEPVRLITRHTLSEGRARRSVNVLLAEDNHVNQMVAQALLKKFGYHCDIASDGEEAVAAARTGHYRLILMDCQMPVLDGYEATRRIRLLEGPAGQVPIVAMTASAMAGDRERCIAAGMDDYVSKPIDPQELRAAVRRALLSDAAQTGDDRTSPDVTGGALADPDLPD